MTGKEKLLRMTAEESAQNGAFQVILRSCATKNPYLTRCFACAQHDGKKEILRCAQDDCKKKRASQDDNKGCSG